MDASALHDLVDDAARWLQSYALDDTAATRWLLASGIALAVALLVYLIKAIVVHRLRAWSKRTAGQWDDRVLEMLQQTRWWFILALAAYVGAQVLFLPAADATLAPDSVRVLPESGRAPVNIAMIWITLIQAGVWGSALIGFIADAHIARRQERDPAVRMTVGALAWIARLVLYTVLILLALDNVGVEVAALVAGLGVGGIAIALAVQTILGDLLASLSIVFDKPFVPGDFIIVGDQLGTVEKIGLKTTRVSSLSGEQIIFPNQDLLQSRVHNYARMTQRRVVFSIGVTYDTSAATLAEIPGVIREAVEAQSQARFDRAHFKAFGDSSLNFEAVYYVLSPDFAVYMDVQQAINLSLVERLEQMQVEFAFPTRTLHIETPEAAEKTVPRRRS